MSELVFLYIEDVKRGIENQNINFSMNFYAEYHNNSLLIKEKINKYKDFFGKNITNISLLIGKNGVGKTTILDLIGLNKRYRDENFVNGKYFYIFHVRDNLFYFEGTLARKLNNITNKPKNFNSKSFFFRTNNDFELEYINAQNFEMEIYYQRLTPNIAWTKNKREFTEKSRNIYRYSSNSPKVNEVLDFIKKGSTDIDTSNTKIEVSQKEHYTNNPTLLAKLYCMDRWGNFDNSLTKFFVRGTQDNYFDSIGSRKYYFIIRFLEKRVIRILEDIKRDYKRLKEKDYFFRELNDEEFQDDKDLEFERIFKRIAVFRESYSIGSHRFLENEISKDRINFLLGLIYFLKNNSKQKREKVDYDWLFDMFDSLDETNYITKNSFEINLIESDIKFFERLIIEFRAFFDVKFKNLSDGELVYFNTFAQLHSILNKSSSKNLLILLDEPDINLHPEWSRTFIKKLVDIIDYSSCKSSIQLLISSHSPFMITDIPKENIASLRETKRGIYSINQATHGFAGNLYDIISSSFFMEYPIGEFARMKLDSVKNMKDFEIKKNLVNLVDDSFLKNVMLEQIKVDSEKNDKNF